MTDPIASTPPPPYVAVVFTSVRSAGDNGYAATAAAMVDLAARQPRLPRRRGGARGRRHHRVVLA